MLGLGDLQNVASFNRMGVMGNVGASANDPIFLVHHTFVDCLFEEWLKINYASASNYPTAGSIPQGHGLDDYMVPFFPLYTNRDMFKPSENFGYVCSPLPSISPSSGTSTKPTSLWWLLILVCFFWHSISFKQ